MTTDYSIIVPAYNEENYLPETLSSLEEAMAALPEFSGEIIVTDNNSTDRTAEIAEATGARVVFEEHRQISRARNVGAREACGRHLIFVDADTRISPLLLKKTLATLESGTICGVGTTVQFDGELNFTAKCALKAWIFLSKTLKWACGAYVFCTREAFQGTGGFDEKYYVSEEIHFSNALRLWGKRKGKTIVILDEPIITSSRKMEWYNTWEIMRMLLGMLCHFRPLRNRAACHKMWYRRPGDD